MQYSKLTQKYQTTIPLSIRKLLKLGSGDVVSFTIKNNKVMIEKAQSFDLKHYKSLQQTLSSEWESAQDNDAYNHL